jgi:hypothetical protein
MLIKNKMMLTHINSIINVKLFLLCMAKKVLQRSMGYDDEGSTVLDA